MYTCRALFTASSDLLLISVKGKFSVPPTSTDPFAAGEIKTVLCLLHVVDVCH